MEQYGLPLFLLATVAAVGAYLFWDTHRRERLMLREITRSFGQVPQDSAPRSLTDAWWSRIAATAPPRITVDSRTWQDLDMDEIYTRLNACRSAVGEGYLYAALHMPQPPDVIARRQALAQTMATHESARTKVQLALARTGRKRGEDFSLLLFSPDFTVFRFSWVYPVLAVLPLALLFFFFFPWGPGALLFSLCANIALCQWARMKTGRWMEALNNLSRILVAAGHVCQALHYCAPQISQSLARELKALQKAQGPLSRFVRTGDIAGGADFLLDGINMVFLLPVLQYLRTVRQLRSHPQALEQLFCTLGEVELAICAASFAAGQSAPVCAPQWLDAGRLEAEEVRHPLLPQAVPNSGQFRRCALFTGSNASGKSTFLKALAVNALLAQTLGLCTARRFALRTGPCAVVSSMALTDNLLAGESYFVAELHSLLRVLRRAQRGEHFLCFVDEILRGTNPEERLAASQAVMRYLAGSQALAFVATHDVELADALADVCDNYHFSEQARNGAVTFDYLLRPGPARGRNAIRLMGQLGFPASIVAQARLLAGMEQA